MISDQSSLLVLFDELKQRYEEKVQPLENENNMFGVSYFSQNLKSFKETFERV